MEEVRTVLIFLLAVVVSTFVARLLPIRLPLPLLQIALGACLAWLGLGVQLDPHLFLLVFIPPVALNIRNAETERLAEEVAKLTGETKTEAVSRALRDRLARLRRERAGRRLADELDEIALHCAALPVRDRRSADEILGYDEQGLPSR
jgi:antitoxin VapB